MRLLMDVYANYTVAIDGGDGTVVAAVFRVRARRIQEKTLAETGKRYPVG